MHQLQPQIHDDVLMKSDFSGQQADHTWLLMLLLSPNTNHPPTQAARKEWDCKLFPWILSCTACSPLYVNTKHARLREWVYVAFKMALSLSFRLSEERKNLFKLLTHYINIKTARYFMTSQILTCHFWIEMSSPRHVVLWFWPHIWELKHTVMSVGFKTRS